MSVNAPPNPNVSTFNNLYWITADISLTQAAADLRYLKWNVAQGDEVLQGIVVNGNSTFYSPSVSFINTVAPTSTATQPASNDSSTKIPTTAWVQTAVTGSSILASNNTFTGTNAFNNVAPITSTATQPASNDSSTKIPTTAWVQTAVSGSSILATNNTFTGTNAFNNVAPITSTATQPASSDSSTKIPTTAWVQTAVSGSSILATNNTFTGTNAFNNVAPPTSSSTQPASSDSSTKIPTTAWVQSAITGATIPANLTPNSITITRTNLASSSTAGIINNYNNGGYIDQGFLSSANSPYNANFTPNVPLQIVIANNSGNPAFSLFNGFITVNINCFFYNTAKSQYGQFECKLNIFGFVLGGNFGSTNGTIYNLNNQINGNGAFNMTDPVYAPIGREYWTYDQVFSGARAATPGYLQGVNNGDGTYSIFVYFQADQQMIWCYNATIINTAFLVAGGGKGVYLA
jgi:hypothetical protein